MAKLRNCKYSEKGNLLIVKFEDVENFANEQLSEFSPTYFHKPKKLDAESFAEFHLKLPPRYIDTGNSKILGMTIFRDGKQLCYDEDGHPMELYLRRGEYYIDEKSCALRAHSNEKAHTVISPTILHECGHLQFDMQADPDVLCGDGFYLFSSGEDCLPKSQALYFADLRAEHYAYSLLAPREFVKIMYEEQFKRMRPMSALRNGNQGKIWLRIIKMADFFGITQTAMAMRIKKTIPEAAPAMKILLGHDE